MSKKVQPLHLYTEAMPRSRVRDPPGAYAVGCDCQIIFLAIAQLVERSIVVVHSNKSRMVPGSIPGGEKDTVSEWSKEMDLSPIGRLSAQVRILPVSNNIFQIPGSQQQLFAF